MDDFVLSWIPLLESFIDGLIDAFHLFDAINFKSSVRSIVGLGSRT